MKISSLKSIKVIWEKDGIGNKSSIDVAKSIFFTDQARILKTIYEKGSSNWSGVVRALYNGVSRNFDIFRRMAYSKLLIMQTEETRNAKTKNGKPKFFSDSLSDGAFYQCTPFGEEVAKDLESCSNTLLFIDNLKRWRYESKKTSMSFYEFMITCSIRGINALTKEFIENEILNELATPLGKEIKPSFARRVMNFYSKFPDVGQDLENLYNQLC